MRHVAAFVALCAAAACIVAGLAGALAAGLLDRLGGL